jgi:lipopolysaccharide transport system ATP-binding protein
MTDTVISVEQLSKAYHLGVIGGPSAYRTAAARLRGRSSAPTPAIELTGEEKPRSRNGLFWALDAIDFDVAHGDAIAIIGANGAGKSTLLKILSRVTAPTNGYVKLKGKVASLLEVGTGFHPDLTGRENVFLNGAILGMSRRELDHKFEEILDFSGVEEFIDTPVKRYSSGMYVRLAFAVAAHLQPDILILDEVLAVGDAAFQRKCLGKMDEAAKQGRTVLFVSHNMVAVQSLCSRAVLLEDGRITANGAVSDVVRLYLSKGVASGTAERVWNDASVAPGNDTVRLTRLTIAPGESDSSNADADDNVIAMSTPIRVDLEYQRMIADKKFHIEIHLLTDQDFVLLYTSPGFTPGAVGGYHSFCTIPGNLLNSGGYRIKVMVVEDEARATWLEDATLAFSVEDLRQRRMGWMSKRPGILYIPIQWRTSSTTATSRESISDAHLVSNYEPL